MQSLVAEPRTTHRQVSFSVCYRTVKWSGKLATNKQKASVMQQQKTIMRKQTKSTPLVNHDRANGADTNGFKADNASDFIRKRAYQLFEVRGRGLGHELEDWLQAEREIRTRIQT